MHVLLQFPSLGAASSGPLRHPMAGMTPLGLPTLPSGLPAMPSGVPTVSGGNSLGMSFPGMPLLGPQMVLPPMAPDGTLLSPSGLHGYPAHMQPFPYMFPGMGHAGMQINPMQVRG
ncbi:hypothetical protein MMC07_002598 [Pseudocyphellaria aurata]|nr:hypothetical protein [Pseudocyphellaria aurata]